MLLGKFNKVVKVSLMLVLQLFICSSWSQNSKIDSLLNLLKRQKEDTNKINILSRLSKQLVNASEYKGAMLYADQGKALGEKLSSASNSQIVHVAKRGLANAYNVMAVIYWYQGDYQTSLQLHFKALKIREEIKDKSGLGNSLNNIGMVYAKQGDYVRSIEHYLKALKIMEELGIKNGIAATNDNIGIIYDLQGDYQMALEHYYQALKIDEELGEKGGVAAVLNNIGNVYNMQALRIKFTNTIKSDSLFNLALKQQFAALKINEEMADRYGLAGSLINIGVIYFNKGYYEKALEQHLMALKIKEELGDKEGIALSCVNIGSGYSRLKKYKEAEKYLNDALMLSKQIGHKEWARDSYRSLATMDSSRGNWRAAYNHNRQYILYRDSLVNESNTKKTVQAQMNYEFDKKEQAVKIEQEKKDVISNEEKQKQTIIIASVSTGLILVLVLALFTFRSLKQNQKKNKIITEQKELVETQKHIVEEKQKEILDSIYYAKRIQTALITSERYIDKSLNRLKI